VTVQGENLRTKILRAGRQLCDENKRLLELWS
jgi:hypothetical protein